MLKETPRWERPPAGMLGVISADLLAGSADPPGLSQMTLSVRIPPPLVSNSPAGGGTRLLLQQTGGYAGGRAGRGGVGRGWAERLNNNNDKKNNNSD